MHKTFNLQIPSGMKDLLPDEARKKRNLENVLIAKFLDWSYQEVITPVLEYYDHLVPAETPDDQFFKLIDRRGNILALRTDMTTPIARMVSTRFSPEQYPLRLFYLSNVFRYENPQMGRQREFYQAGVELIGESGPAADAEAIALAAECLREAQLKGFQISIGHIDFFRGIVNELDVEAGVKERIIRSVAEKDFVELEILLETYRVNAEMKSLILSLPSIRGDISVVEKAEKLIKNPMAKAALENLRQVFQLLRVYGVDQDVFVDFGIMRDFDYYSGIVFEGYSPGVGVPICGGGRYDHLLGQYGSEAPATGFAIGIERLMLALEKQKPQAKPFLTIALPKGKLGSEAIQALKDVGYPTAGLETDSRKLLFSYPEHRVRYIVCRPTDVPTYVDYGAADIGMVGKDSLVESNKDVFELVDLKFGLCRFVVAVPEQVAENLADGDGKVALSHFNHARVATKFPRVAETFFRDQGIQVEVVKLHGNIELAPMVNLAELIVDIVSSGATLKENNLVPIADIFPATARLIANRVSYRMKHRQVQELAEKLRDFTGNGGGRACENQ
ncbi:hypothetical protein DCMF_00090 [Candidatus Formimonas warabiya]|uniref:Multifunctional fusion protein n=2 Tax=Formimonas warabiya TaxID=1761012 RepID=A0A3G1KLW0_FORW1|nr:hypothetical protein DCMF_00090 [Candidatus Formimonas warabiya]